MAQHIQIAAELSWKTSLKFHFFLFQEWHLFDSHAVTLVI